MTTNDKAPTRKCVYNLKMIGQGMIMYFNNDNQEYFPTNITYKYLDKDSQISKLFDLKETNLSCPIKRKKHKGLPVYVANKNIEGTHLNIFENADSIIAYDGTTTGDVSLHFVGSKTTTLFGDGHVETINMPNE